MIRIIVQIRGARHTDLKFERDRLIFDGNRDQTASGHIVKWPCTTSHQIQIQPGICLGECHALGHGTKQLGSKITKTTGRNHKIYTELAAIADQPHELDHLVLIAFLEFDKPIDHTHDFREYSGGAGCVVFSQSVCRALGHTFLALVDKVTQHADQLINTCGLAGIDAGPHVGQCGDRL